MYDENVVEELFYEEYPGGIAGLDAYEQLVLNEDANYDVPQDILDAPFDDNDPGSEEDQEIARNGPDGFGEY